MKMSEVPSIKCVKVEYDKKYFGGDYKDVGEFTFIPFNLIDVIKNPNGKAVMKDEKALKIAFKRMTGLDHRNIIHFSFDEPVDQFGQIFKETSTEFEVVTKPLTKEEAKKRLINKRLKAIVQVSMDDLLDPYREMFNSLCEELILEEGVLRDIKYQIVGAKDQWIFVEVDAEMFFPDENEE